MERSRRARKPALAILAAIGVGLGSVAVAVVRAPDQAPVVAEDSAEAEPAAPPPLSPSRPANTPPAATAPRSVGWVGDSIGWQSHGAIEAQLSRRRHVSSFNSIIGATVEAQRPAAVEAVQGPDSPDILLVELGHNDASRIGLEQFAADVRRFLDGVTPHVDCVRWFDVKRGGSPVYDAFNENAIQLNAVLAEVIADYPTVRTVAYSAWADVLGPSAFDSDGVHLSPRGELELGHLAARAADLCEGDLDSGLI